MITFSFLVAASILLVAAYVVYQRYISGLAAIPGPVAASLSRWWLVKYTRQGDLHRQTLRLHEYYGPLVRIAPNEVSVANPSAIKQIYGEPRAYLYKVMIRAEADNRSRLQISQS